MITNRYVSAFEFQTYTRTRTNRTRTAHSIRARHTDSVRLCMWTQMTAFDNNTQQQPIVKMYGIKEIIRRTTYTQLS